MAFPPMSSRVDSHFQLLMEHFDNPDQLQVAINCSEKCAGLLKNPATMPLSEYCPYHPQRRLKVFCRQCETELCIECVSHAHSTHKCTCIGAVTSEETRRLGEAENHLMGLLEETKRALSVVKEMRQRVKHRREYNMERTREVFNALRKVIDDQEEQVIGNIKKGADKREKALKVLLYRIVIWVWFARWTYNCHKYPSSSRGNILIQGVVITFTTRIKILIK